MQRYGPPPSYPNLKIPGLTAAIPEVSKSFNAIIPELIILVLTVTYIY